MQRPFILTNQSWISELNNDNQAFSQHFKDFVSMFDSSTIKITEGRAQKRIMDDNVMEVVTASFQKSVEGAELILKFADDDCKNAFPKTCASMFGIACGHQSNARFELVPLRKPSSRGNEASLPAAAIMAIACLPVVEGSNELAQLRDLTTANREWAIALMLSVLALLGATWILKGVLVSSHCYLA